MLFVAVADAAGLAGASRATGVSVPTLSRRMSDLERTLGVRLFARGPRGYALTSQGRELLHQAEDLRPVAAKLAAFSHNTGRTKVRITAGQWTAQFLARNISRFWTHQTPWVPEFIASNAVVDIARREADIGVRNNRPEQSWLAGRMTRQVDYAVFGLSADTRGYIAQPEADTGSRSNRWLWSIHSDEIVTTASSPRLAADLALAGVGRVVLPVFAAASFPSLQRLSGTIADLRHDEWLVCHHDSRHDPPIRAALDAIGSLLTDPGLRSEAPST